MRPLPVRALHAVAIAALSLPLAVAPVAAGAPNPGQTLVPTPPSYYTCTAYGAGTVCHADRVDVYGPEPMGLWCDGPGSAFEIWDQAIRHVSFTRWYNTEGLIVRRLIINTFDDAHLSNPLSAKIVEYIQRDRDMEHFTIPGDLDSSIRASTGSITAVVPGRGAVLVERGRYVTSGDEVLQATGRRDLTDAFEGDPNALDAVCAALAG